MAGTTTPPARDRRVALTAVALVALALVAGVVIRLGAAASPSAAADLGDPVIGDPDAPVEIVEYSDFGCPYCAQHARDIKPSIIADYVDTGVARYVWRDYPLQGEDSERAALAGRAAQEQGRFWEFHDALFAESGSRLDSERLYAAAKDAGLDLDAFQDSVRAEEHRSLVEAGREQATELGLTGTPSFTVNGERIMGAQPYEVFAEVIERHAEAADGAG